MELISRDRMIWSGVGHCCCHEFIIILTAAAARLRLDVRIAMNGKDGLLLIFGSIRRRANWRNIAVGILYNTYTSYIYGMESWIGATLCMQFWWSHCSCFECRTTPRMARMHMNEINIFKVACVYCEHVISTMERCWAIFSFGHRYYVLWPHRVHLWEISVSISATPATTETMPWLLSKWLSVFWYQMWIIGSPDGVWCISQLFAFLFAIWKLMPGCCIRLRLWFLSRARLLISTDGSRMVLHDKMSHHRWIKWIMQANAICKRRSDFPVLSLCIIILICSYNFFNS